MLISSTIVWLRISPILKNWIILLQRYSTSFPEKLSLLAKDWIETKKSDIPMRKGKFENCNNCHEEFNVGMIIKQHQNLCKKYSELVISFDDSFQCKLCKFNDSNRPKLLWHISKKHKQYKPLKINSGTDRIIPVNNVEVLPNTVDWQREL